MSNFVEILDKIENRFISNSHNAPILVETLIELDALVGNTNDHINLGLLNALKKEVLKQKLDNPKHKPDTWKKHTSQSQTSGRLQAMITKHMLRNLIPTGSKSADVAKIFNVGQKLVARRIKFRGLTTVVPHATSKQKDKSQASEISVDVKNLKNSQPISLDVIRRRVRKSRIPSAF